MKTFLYNKVHIFLLLVCMLNVASCIHDYPDEAFGEGIDPTLIEVNLKISMESEEVFTIKSEEYRRRFVIDVYSNDETPVLIERKNFFYDDVEYSGGMFRLPFGVKLPSEDYCLIVWSDFVTSDFKDSFYNLDNLQDIVFTTPYKSTPYKDAFIGKHDLILTEYAGGWGITDTVRIEMERPVSPIRFIATDWEEFEKLYGKEVSDGFYISVRFETPLPLGYNAFTSVTQRPITGVNFTSYVRPDSDASSELMMFTDFVFCNLEQSETIVSIDIINNSGNVLNTVSNIRVPYKKNFLTTLKSNFLTSKDNSDIDVDVEFDDDIIIDLD